MTTKLSSVYPYIAAGVFAACSPNVANASPECTAQSVADNVSNILKTNTPHGLTVKSSFKECYIQIPGMKQDNKLKMLKVGCRGYHDQVGFIMYSPVPTNCNTGDLQGKTLGYILSHLTLTPKQP